MHNSTSYDYDDTGTKHYNTKTNDDNHNYYYNNKSPIVFRYML